MTKKFQTTFVISLGGSIIVPDKIDVVFLKQFKKFILSFIQSPKSYKLKAKSFRFIIVAGGGKIARNFQQAARAIDPVPNEDMDWLGIHATRINAHLLRTIFRKFACPVVLDNPLKKVNANYPIVVASGWRPGRSTDYDTVLLAKRFGAKEFINISKADYVYDKDNNKYSDAKPILDISWKEYRKMIPQKWTPGISFPIDPIAAKTAQAFGLTVKIIGKDLPNLKKCLLGKPFKGTFLHP